LEISNRNAELMAAEEKDEPGSGSKPEEAPPAKWYRRTILDDDEAEMASTLLSLPSLPQINPVEDEDVSMSEGEEDRNRNFGSGDEEVVVEQSENVSNIDIDCSADWGSLMDNGVRFKLLLLLSF
jgi:hypothetical protein